MYSVMEAEEVSKGNLAEALKYSKRTVEVSHKEIMMAMQFLDVLGVEYYMADGESDRLLAQLTNTTANSYCVTSDSDVLVHDSPNILLKHKKQGHFEHLHKEEILETLGMDKDQFLLFCVLLGTDYNSNIKGLGWRTLEKLIKDGMSLSDIYDKKAAKQEAGEKNKIEEVLSFFQNQETPGFTRTKRQDSVDMEMFDQLFVQTKCFTDQRIESLWKNLETIKKSKTDLISL